MRKKNVNYSFSTMFYFIWMFQYLIFYSNKTNLFRIRTNFLFVSVWLFFVFNRKIDWWSWCIRSQREKQKEGERVEEKREILVKEKKKRECEREKRPLDILFTSLSFYTCSKEETKAYWWTLSYFFRYCRWWWWQ